MSQKQTLFDTSSTSPTSAIINVGEDSCVQIRAFNLGPGEEVVVELVSLNPGSYPKGVINSCLPNPVASGPQVIAAGPYSPCGYQQFLLDETRNTIVIRSPGFYQFQLTPAALGTAIVEAIFYEGDEACNAVASECCCQPEIAWLGTSTSPCLTITPGGPAGHSPVFSLDACCLLQSLPANPNPVLTDRLVFLSGPDCFTATIDEIFSMAVVCDSLGEFGIGAPVAGDTLVALDAGENCKRVDAQTLVTDFETPWTGTSNNANLTITPGGVNGHAPVFDYDLCADIQAIPSCACVPNTGDGVLIIQGGDCVLATWPAVDLCEQIGLLPLGGVLPDDRIPVREAGGACKYLPASTFLSGVAFPLAAPDGSCLAPSYSFATDPTSGMFFDPASPVITGNPPAVVISYDDCGSRIDVSDIVRITALSGDFIEVGASVNISATGGGGNFTATSTNNLTLTSTAGVLDFNGFTGFNVLTAGLPRFTIGSSGDWFLPASPGSLGQVITSQGPGTPPIWDGVGSVPILGADGACAAPTYSFTSDPATGMFYDPATPQTGLPAVTIGYSSCASRLDVGPTIYAEAGGAFIWVGVGGGQIIGSAAAGVGGTGANINFVAGSGDVGFGGGTGQLSGGGANGVGTFGGQGYVTGGGASVPGETSGSATLTGGGASGGSDGGDANVFGANTTGPGQAGSVNVSGGAGASAALSGDINFRVNNPTLILPIDFQITRLREWKLAGVEGTAGQYLGSNGTGFAPTWQSIGASPIIAVDGSCAAPTYSFTSSPDSGMFYDPAGVGSVVIGDDNCVDSIAIGASITIQTNSVVRHVYSNSGEWLIGGTAGTAGQAIVSNGAGTPPTWQTPAGVSEPITQIVYGTGPAVDSSPFFLWGVLSGQFNVNINSGGSNLSVLSGAANDVHIRGVTVTNGTGRSVIINGGEGQGGGDGGQIFINGGRTTSTTRFGGAVNITGGVPSTGGNATGGPVNITSGAGEGNGSPGAVTIFTGNPGGAATNNGGTITIRAGNAAGIEIPGNNNSPVTVSGNAAAYAAAPQGQDVAVVSGTGGTGAVVNAPSGNVRIRIGEPNGTGNRGQIQFESNRPATLPLARFSGYGDLLLAGYGNGTNGGENTQIPAAQTTGFVWLPRVDGAPSSVPAGTTLPGGGLGFAVPFLVQVVDAATLRLWAYNTTGAAWQSADLT